MIDKKKGKEKKVSALEYIDKIVNLQKSLPLEIAIGKTLVKRLKTMAGEDGNGITYFEQKMEEYACWLVNLVFKLSLDLEAKEKPALADGIQSVYVKLIQERDYDPIDMNLSNSGLTPKFILDELASAKSIPMRSIFLYYIPTEKISPAICFRIFIMLQYVDNWQGSWLLEEMFEHKRISIADAEMYAVCWFLHNRIWKVEDISKENRAIGIGALMGIGTDAVYKRLREITGLKSEIAVRIKDMLTPAAEGNMFDSSTSQENKNLPDEEKGGIDHSERDKISVSNRISLLQEEKKDIIDNLFKSLKDREMSIEDARFYLQADYKRLRGLTGGNKFRMRGLKEGIEYIISHTQDEEVREAMKQELQNISKSYRQAKISQE